MGLCLSSKVDLKEDKNAATQPKNNNGIAMTTIPRNQKNIEDVYEINEDILGQGSFGEVRIVTHKLTNQKRIVKIIYYQDE